MPVLYYADMLRLNQRFPNSLISRELRRVTSRSLAAGDLTALLTQ